MRSDDVRFLFGYDRWATRQVLAQLDELDKELWERTNVVAERGLGGILVHHLGASQRWRIAFETQGEGSGPRPEQEPLPDVDALRERWEIEWQAVDAWLSTLSEGFLAASFEGVPVWQMVVHVINHGTQHRSEAAALLSSEGRSPGDLDLVDYAYAQVESRP